MKPLRMIVVPTDFSPHAAGALHLAAELAKGSEAALCLVHVYDLTPHTLPEGVPLYDASMMARLREELAQRLARCREDALALGVARVETKLLEGQPYREIVRAAEESDAQLIVMGTHGRSGLAHLLLGSVAEKVVRKGPCPVLVVPLKQEGAKQVA